MEEFNQIGLKAFEEESRNSQLNSPMIFEAEIIAQNLKETSNEQSLKCKKK